MKVLKIIRLGEVPSQDLYENVPDLLEMVTTVNEKLEKDEDELISLSNRYIGAGESQTYDISGSRKSPEEKEDIVSDQPQQMLEFGNPFESATEEKEMSYPDTEKQYECEQLEDPVKEVQDRTTEEDHENQTADFSSVVRQESSEHFCSGKDALDSDVAYQMFSSNQVVMEVAQEDETSFLDYEFSGTIKENSDDLSLDQFNCSPTRKEVSSADDNEVTNEVEFKDKEDEMDEQELVDLDYGTGDIEDYKNTPDEFAEPELIAIDFGSGDVEEELDMDNRFSYKVTSDDCVDADEQEDDGPFTDNYQLNPHKFSDLDRPLSPLPDDAHRISGSERSSVSDLVQTGEEKGDVPKYFEHLENLEGQYLQDHCHDEDDSNIAGEKPCQSDEDFDERIDNQRNDELEFKTDVVDEETELAQQASDFVNAVLKEAQLAIRENGSDSKLLEHNSSDNLMFDDGTDRRNDVNFDGVRRFECYQTDQTEESQQMFHHEFCEQVTDSSEQFTEIDDNDGELISFSDSFKEESQNAFEKQSMNLSDQYVLKEIPFSTYDDQNLLQFTTNKDEKSSNSEEKEMHYPEEFVQEGQICDFEEDNDIEKCDDFVYHRVEETKHDNQEFIFEKNSHQENWFATGAISEQETTHISDKTDDYLMEPVENVVCEKFTVNKEDNRPTNFEDFLTKANETFQKNDNDLEKKNVDDLASPEDQGDSSSVDSFATVVPCQQESDDRLADLSSVSSSFHSDIHSSFQEDQPYITIDARDDDNVEGHDDSSSSSDRFEMLERSDLESSIIEVAVGFDTAEEEGYGLEEKDEFDDNSLMMLATIREEEEKASLSGKSEKTSSSSERVEMFSNSSERMTSSPDIQAESPGVIVEPRFFSNKNAEKDNISVSSSLLEFEHLEKEVQDKTSSDSFGSRLTTSSGKSGERDDVSVSSSLAEFERLEGELGHSDSMEKMSLQMLGSTTSLNAFPVGDLDTAKLKFPDTNPFTFEDNFESEANKVATMLEGSSSLPFLMGNVESNSVIGNEKIQSPPSTSGIANAASTYPEYQHIVQIIREASETAQAFDFQGGNIPGAEKCEEVLKEEQDEEESDSEAVITAEAVDLQHHRDQDDDSLQEDSDSRSRSGAIDLDVISADQASLMQASTDSFEFDTVAVNQELDSAEKNADETKPPGKFSKYMDASSESGAWSQTDSMVSTETVKTSDSLTNIMHMSMDSPESEKLHQETKMEEEHVAYSRAAEFAYQEQSSASETRSRFDIKGNHMTTELDFDHFERYEKWEKEETSSTSVLQMPSLLPESTNPFFTSSRETQDFNTRTFDQFLESHISSTKLTSDDSATETGNQECRFSISKILTGSNHQ